jgi:hypothetical protein
LAQSFVELKAQRLEDAERIMREAARLHRHEEEHVAGYHVRTRVQNALRYVEATDLADSINNCSRSARCQSLWCADCRRTAAQSIETQMRKRIIDEEDLYLTLSGSTEIDRSKPDFNTYMNSEHRHVSGYVGLFSLDQDKIEQGLSFDRRRWKKIKERKSNTKFWIAGNYEFELVNYRYLLQRTNQDSEKKQKQIQQLLAYSIEQGWIKRTEGVGVLLHWHALTNANDVKLEQALGDAYWLDDERLFKTGKTGLYVQGLHANKGFDENVQKIASYALKSATRYKHSFIGSDVGDELMLKSELGRLIQVYHGVQGRSWRSMVLNHSIG